MKGQGKSHVALLYAEREEDLRERIQKGHQLAGFIIEYLLEAYENTGKNGRRKCRGNDHRFTL